LLFYFGWVFTNARALYFGIDPSTLGLSTQDYLLRSIDPIFLPLGALLTIALLLLVGHATVTRWIYRKRHGRLRALEAVTAIAAAGSLVVGMLGVGGRPLLGIETLVTPLALALGIVCTSYAGYVRRVITRLRRPAEPPTPRWISFALAVILAMLLMLSLFWVTHDWATAVGVGRARALERALSSRPGVSVYSKEQLQISAPGVDETRLPEGDTAAYRFQYDGLKLLIRSGGWYFLLPVEWTRADGSVIVLQEGKDVRLEFSPSWVLTVPRRKSLPLNATDYGP